MAYWPATQLQAHHERVAQCSLSTLKSYILGRLIGGNHAWTATDANVTENDPR
jgi:hypothetical protein